MDGYEIVVRVKMKKKDAPASGWFGKGVAELLEGVERHHSLNMAANEMGMAYSKAWRIMKDAEAALGIPLLNRMGKRGSELTFQGKKLLVAYGEAQEAARDAADAVMQTYYENKISKVSPGSS